MADYYPVLARAVSGLAYKDSQARLDLYARARTIVTEQLRHRNPQDLASATLREQAALEAAIRRVEAELQPAEPRPADRSAPPRPPANVSAKTPTQNTANSLSKILQALQTDAPSGRGADLSALKAMNGTKALVVRPPTPIANFDNRKINRNHELGDAPNSLGTMLLGIAYVVAALAFTGVTYIRCIVWIAQGVIGYPVLLVVMAITLGLFIAPPIVFVRKAPALPSFSVLRRFIYSASRRVF
jgi:hypothetical protein